MTVYKIARAKKIGMFRLKRFRQIRKLYVAALLEELTNTIDVAEIGTGVQLRAAVAAGWDELMIPEDLRFWSKDEQRRVFDGFKFPAVMRSKSRNKNTPAKKFFYLKSIDWLTLENTLDEILQSILATRRSQ